MRIVGRSKALYSTWFYLPTFKILLDAGEGAAATLGTETSDIQYIFLSHMHMDHWTGLPAIARFQKRVIFKDERHSMATVLYHPDFQKEIEHIRAFLERGNIRLFFRYQPLEIGKNIHIRDQFFLRPFLVDHQPSYYQHPLTAMGVHLVEKRKKLNSEFAVHQQKLNEKFKNEPGKASDAFREFMIGQKKQYGNDESRFVEYYDHKILSYCGDSRPVDPKEVFETEILMHECTFLEKDEVESAHSSLPEVLQVAKKSRCKNLLLFHISERYRQERKQYIEEIIKKAKSKLSSPVFAVPVDKTFFQDVEASV
ncbi:MAG: MBL fold metallo-hydrolase [Parcubacteria group bacterium]|nr:MBL fold metallo-hydrolase [Parcubacteria group bacterium]